MSPPDTNIEKQAKRHKGPLTGMPLAIAVATVVFLGFLAWSALTDTDTSGAQSVTETETSEGQSVTVPQTETSGG